MPQDSLGTMIARIEERQIHIAESMVEMKDTFKAHTENDSKEFGAIRKEISSMNRYAASVAVVSGALGVGLTLGWKFIKGLSL